MKRKILVLFLVLVTLFGLASCGKNGTSDDGSSSKPSDFLVYEIAKSDSGILSLAVIGIEKGKEDVKSISIPAYISVTITKEDRAVVNEKGYLEKTFANGVIHFTNETLPEDTDVLKLSVTEISILAFSGLEKLESVYLPKTITAIGGEAMKNCYSLKSISIPEGVFFISSSVFEGCVSLKSVDLPRSTMAIEDCAFKGCDNLQTINYAGSNRDWRNILIFENGNEQINKAKIIYGKD